MCPVCHSPYHRCPSCTSHGQGSNLHWQQQYCRNFQHTTMPPPLQPYPYQRRWCMYLVQHPAQSPPYPRRTQLCCWCYFMKQFRTCSTICAQPHHLTFFTPSITTGGPQKMIHSSVRARQPHRLAWTHERLLQKRAIALRQAIDNSTWKNYRSALNSYLNFVKLHDLPLKPTPDTLSLFTIYMCHHIKPGSVATYLSGICQQLEPYFPNIHTACNSALVHRTLQGCKRLRATSTTRKRALTLTDLETVINALADSLDYDDILFLAQLLTGFFALFRLGELTYQDDPELCDPCKVTKQMSVRFSDTSFQFFLPGHKADRFF